MLNGIWGYVKKFIWGENKKKDKKKIYAKSTITKEIGPDLQKKYRPEDYRLENLAKSLPSTMENRDEILAAGAYLFDNGYDQYDLEYLGAGSFNTVFKIVGTDRIVKYCKSVKGYNDGVSVDEMSIRDFEKMIENIKDAELKKWADKYLPKIKRINQKDIYEDTLGIGDLKETTVKKRKEQLKNSDTSNGTKTLYSLIRKTKNAAKVLFLLHKMGYVHQDIKPANIMKIANPNFPTAEKVANTGKTFKDKTGEYCVVSEKSEEDKKIRYFKKYKSGEKHKIHKNQINVTDMGMMYPIVTILEMKSPQVFGTPAYMSKEDKTIPPATAEDVMKRDVYALGITLFELMCGRYPVSVEKGEGLKYELPGLTENKDRDRIRAIINEWLEKNSITKIYKEEATRLRNFIKLIYNMTCSRKNRFLISSVMPWIRKIESKNL